MGVCVFNLHWYETERSRVTTQGHSLITVSGTLGLVRAKLGQERSLQTQNPHATVIFIFFFFW